MPQADRPSARTRILLPGAIQDPARGLRRDVAIAARNGWIIDLGSIDEIRQRTPAPHHVDHHPEALAVPGLVNAHVHLDLTPLGPRPYDGDFPGWLAAVARDRPHADHAYTAAIARGRALSLDAGVRWVGDIASPPPDAPSLAPSPSPRPRLQRTAMLEILGFGPRAEAAEARAAAWLDPWPATVRKPGPLDAPADRPGLAPHAPYSTDEALLRFAADRAGRGTPVTLHLAESPEEDAFVRHRRGPLLELLRRLAPDADPGPPAERSPVQWLLDLTPDTPWALVHVNYADDDDLGRLAASRCSVVYCPIASAYFGHHDHRCRDMLDAGINLAIGVDSIVCQPRDAAQPMGLGRAMAHLHRITGLTPRTILSMATTGGLRALGLPEAFANLAPGTPTPIALLQTDPARRDPLRHWLDLHDPTAQPWPATEASPIRGQHA